MSVIGADNIPRWVPVIGIAVETGIGWVILETGFSRRAPQYEISCRAIYDRAGCQADALSRPHRLESMDGRHTSMI